MTQKDSKKGSLVPTSNRFSEFDRAFENFRRDIEKSIFSFPRMEFPSFPKIQEASCDVIDEGKQLKVKVDLPGINKKEIVLNVADNAIEIHAEHSEESEEEKKNYLRKERSQVSYDRIVPLPEKIQSDKVRSRLTDGVLEIVLPKAKPTPAQKKRSVKVQ